MAQAGRLAALIAALSLLAVGLAGCDQGQSQTAKAPPPPPQVTVARPTAKTVVDQDEYVGRFVAVDAIEVRARVSGYLDSIHFQDGQMVKQGDLLFTIDRRPFQNALDQARASLAQAKANLAYAEADLARAQNLIGGNVISQQTLRAAHAGQARGGGQCVGAGGGRAAGGARSGVHRVARARVGAHRRPARVAGQPGDGRHDGHHHAAGDHPVHRSHPLRVHDG